MRHVLKAEFTKLLTIRSTYVLMGLAVLLVGSISFMAEYKYIAPPDTVIPPDVIANAVLSTAGTTSLFIMIAAVLVMTHEYRYNTIVYTLTSAKHRWQVLAAKALVVSMYATVFAIIITLVALLAGTLGTAARGDTMPPQTFDALNIAWRVLFHSVAVALYAFLIAVFVRSVVAAMAMVFVVINIVESLLQLLLKENYQYLPFTAVNSVVSSGDGYHELLDPAKAAWVTLLWLVVLWAVATILFIRRDAN